MKNSLVTIKQSDLVDEIVSDYSGIYSKHTVKNILDSLELHITEHLTETDENHPQKIKLFYGLNLTSKIEPAKSKNCFGVDLDVESHIVAKANFTKCFLRKVNQLAIDN